MAKGRHFKGGPPGRGRYDSLYATRIGDLGPSDYVQVQCLRLPKLIASRCREDYGCLRQR